MNGLAIYIIHPDFEKVKQAGRWLHLLAAILILTHAFSNYHSPETEKLYSWCQIFLGIDILVIIALNKELVKEQPRTNRLLRLIEIIMFLATALILAFHQNWLTATGFFLFTLLFSYQFFCEGKASEPEYIAIHHTGITISGLPESRFLKWSEVNSLELDDTQVSIATTEGKLLRFSLSRTVEEDEKEQVANFNHYYLKQ